MKNLVLVVPVESISYVTYLPMGVTLLVVAILFAGLLHRFVEAPFLEPPREHDRAARTLDSGAASFDVVHDALQLDLEHVDQSARIARTTAVVSERSAKTAVAPQARSSSTE